MTKLVDSLCGVKVLGKRKRIQDSYNDVSPDKIAKAKRYIEEEADRPEDALYEVMDYLYDSPVAIDTDRDVVNVEAKGYHWPNGDAFRSSVVKVNEPGVAMTSLWGSGNPRDLWFIPLPVAEICEIDDPKVTPGYYYLNAETNTIDRIGSTEEDLNKWMRSLDTDETIEAQKREFARREQFERDKRRMSAETSRENVEDSSDDEYRQFDRFNDLREEVSDKEIVDVLPSYMGGYEINKFVDKVRNFYGLDKTPDEEIEDSKDEEMTRRKSAMDELSKLRESVSDKDIVEALVKVSSSEDLFDLIDRLRSNFSIQKTPERKVSDAAYNPKFEKLRRVLSDTTIVEELSHYMSSDELEEFTETLTRNYDIDLEEVEDSSK